MNFKNIYDWVLEKPSSTATVISAALLPYAATELHELLQGGVSKEDALAKIVGVVSPILSYTFMNLGITVVSAVCRSDDKRPRTKIEHFQKRWKLKQKMKSQSPPLMKANNNQPQYSIRNVFFEFLSLFETFDQLFKKEVKHAKKPILSWRQASKELGQDNFDESFEHLKTALELSNGTLPNIARILAWNYWAATWMMRTIYPTVPQAYVFSAAYAALTNPQKAWYYSELGRMVADEFDSPFRKEMYVCHALLASAQGRSDEGEAWRDAIRVASEGAEWERLGESRSVVRVIKNGTFFKNTFLFKHKDSLEAALWEKECYENIGNTVDSVTVPKVLYCSNAQEDGTHTIVMRVLAGETLYDKLKKEEHETMPRVIAALAHIHARFPTEKLKPINLEERVTTGLRAMNLPSELARQITSNYAPVVESLKYSAWAWNKDAHPENWIIGDEISVIDCESKNTSPVMCDVANLLEYDAFFTDEQKREYLGMYVKQYNAQGRHQDERTAMRAYHNAVIHRMICFASAWSDSTRPSLHSKRANALRKGANAIENLRKDDNSWYFAHKEDYDSLERALFHAANLMDAYTS